MRIAHEKCLALQVTTALIQHLKIGGIMWHAEVYTYGIGLKRRADVDAATDTGKSILVEVHNLHGTHPVYRKVRLVGIRVGGQEVPDLYWWNMEKGGGIVLETPPSTFKRVATPVV